MGAILLIGFGLTGGGMPAAEPAQLPEMAELDTMAEQPPRDAGTVALLLRTLREGDLLRQAAALRALGKQGIVTEAVTDALIECLDTDDLPLAINAGLALEWLGSGAEDALVAALNTEANGILRRLRCAVVLGNLKSAQVVQAGDLVRQTLRQPGLDPDVLHECMQLVEPAGLDAAMVGADLLRHAKASTDLTQALLIDLLGKIGRNDAPVRAFLAEMAGPASPREPRMAALQGLVAAGNLSPEERQVVVDALGGTDDHVALAAIRAVTAHPDPLLVDEMAGRLAEGPPELQVRILNLFHELGGSARSAFPAVAACLQSESVRVRLNAVGALARLGVDSPEARQLILSAIADADATVQAHARAAWAALTGGEPVPRTSAP